MPPRHGSQSCICTVPWDVVTGGEAHPSCFVQYDIVSAWDGRQNGSPVSLPVLHAWPP